MNDLLFQSDRTRERVNLVSRTDFEQPLSPDQRRLLELLQRHYGAEHTVTLRELAQRLGTTPRGVKQLVSELRNTPYCIPVCASRSAEHGGYFLAQTHEERRHAAEVLIRQAQAMVRSASTLLDQQELVDSLTRMLSVVQEGVSR
ncbi:hypothetical protein [Terriglobus sp. RCC_193]|uniref:hypothetical protein n=1 Tax=Terriglobus sp. RCC_193 TaxID=3239218 RepID=UPI0035266F53